MFSQLLYHVQRASRQLWHCPTYEFVVILIITVMSLLLGWIVYGLKSIDNTTKLNQVVACIFVANNIVCNLSLQTALPFYYKERLSFYHEQASCMYHPLPWGVAYLLSELPYSIFIAFLHTAIFYVSGGLVALIVII